MRIVSFLIAVLFIFLILCGITCSDYAQTQKNDKSTSPVNKALPTRSPDDEKTIDAAQLVRTIIAEENKIYKIKSIFIRLEGKWINNSETIANRRKELEAKFPGMEIDEKKFSDLMPKINEKLELAFDSKRLRLLHSRESITLDLRTWDGEKAIIHEKYYANNQEHYAFDDSPHNYIGRIFLLDLGYFRAGPHSFWWNPLEDKISKDIVGDSEDFKLIGKKIYHNKECFVLENRFVRRRYYVDIRDGRLRGLQILVFYNGVSSQYLERMRRLTGENFKTFADSSKWLKQLPTDKQIKLEKEIYASLFELAHLMCEFYLDDYREVSPGFWFPMLQIQYDYDDKGANIITAHRELRAIEVKVDEPLADDLFTMKIEEGASIIDWRYADATKNIPPLEYKYKKNFTPEEWNSIIDEYNKKLQDIQERLAKEKAIKDKVLGKTVMDFAESEWLNSKPLKWSDLRGKVVVLSFLAEWCGPCKNDLPRLSDIHEDREISGIYVIGVHTPGSKIEDIEKMLKQFNLNCPVYIDKPPATLGEGYGAMSSWCGIRAIPYSVIVDREGKVADIGPLKEILIKARELVNNVD